MVIMKIIINIIIANQSMENKYNVLITGVAGFIGFHIAKKLCDTGFEVYGIDNLNDYYDVSLKKNRLSILSDKKNFFF